MLSVMFLLAAQQLAAAAVPAPLPPTLTHQHREAVLSCLTAKNAGKGLDKKLQAPRTDHKDREVTSKISTAVVVANSLSAIDGLLISHLAQCVTEVIPGNTGFRPFNDQEDDTEDVYGNAGNQVITLNGFFQYFLPDVWDRLWGTLQFTVDKLALTDHPWMPYQGNVSLADLTARCIEHLTYRNNSALRPHEDGDSVFTLVTMLARPQDHQGGEVRMALKPKNKSRQQQQEAEEEEQEEEEFASFKLQQYSTVVFLSETTHYVQEQRGDRRVLAIEFWKYWPVPEYYIRPPVQLPPRPTPLWVSLLSYAVLLTAFGCVVLFTYRCGYCKVKHLTKKLK